jgi:hypothetical protein
MGLPHYISNSSMWSLTLYCAGRYGWVVLPSSRHVTKKTHNLTVELVWTSQVFLSP